MPVYNCEKYVFEAVESILNQTYAHFELLLIDDCSTDNTLQICKSFQDDRIVIIEKEKNSGYTNSLNYGISIAKGEYIARMDGDDISLPERFEKQINFLQNNPEISLCGTAIQIIGTDEILKQPLNYEQIKVKLCLKTSLYHPTVMGKTTTFRDNLYNANAEPAEDYDLWTRLAFKYALANLDSALLRYRIHENQVSNTRSIAQKSATYYCKLNIFKHLEIEKYFTDDQLRMVLHDKSIKTQADCVVALDMFKMLNDLNNKKRQFNSASFEKLIKFYKYSTVNIFVANNKLSQTNTVIFLLKRTSFALFLWILKTKLVKMFEV
jgi:glycosyltransferase involved in cell wall biosynthesis